MSINEQNIYFGRDPAMMFICYVLPCFLGDNKALQVFYAHIGRLASNCWGTLAGVVSIT